MRKKELLKLAEDRRIEILTLDIRIKELEYNNKYNKSFNDNLKRIAHNIEGINNHNKMLSRQKECKHDTKNFRVHYSCDGQKIYCGDCDKEMKDYDVIFKSK